MHLIYHFECIHLYAAISYYCYTMPLYSIVYGYRLLQAIITYCIVIYYSTRL